MAKFSIQLVYQSVLINQHNAGSVKVVAGRVIQPNGLSSLSNINSGKHQLIIGVSEVQKKVPEQQRGDIR